MISATACGQLLSPKRIIFDKDTGIFFSSPQEIMLLVKMKQLEACEQEKEQWILYANKADKQVDEERIAYDKLFRQYVALEGVSTDFENKYREEFRLHQETKNTLTIQINKKQTWAKIAVGSILVNGTLVYIMSR